MEPIPPVAEVSQGFYRVTGFAEASALLADRRVVANPFFGGTLHPHAPAEALRLNRRGISMQMSDGPVHARLRRAAVLSPLRCRGPLETLRKRVDDRLDALVEDGGGDLLAQVVTPVVVGVICDLLGIPEADRANVHRWAEDSTMPDPAVFVPGGELLETYLSELLALKAEHPDDSVCAELAAAVKSGTLSEVEALGTASILLVAGYETTVTFLALGTLTLMLAPLLRGELTADPTLLTPAIEELLRFVTPTKGTWTRFTLEEIAIGNLVIPAESALEIELLAANHDPRRFPDADRIDPTRSDDKHLAFGAGPHYCPGAALARKEAAVVLAALLPRLEVLQLAAPVTDLTWYQNRFSRRPAEVPVAVHVERRD